MKNKAAMELGRLGGKSTSKAKQDAARINLVLARSKRKEKHPWSHSYFGKGETA